MAKASKIVSLAAVLLLAFLALPIPSAHVAQAIELPSEVWVAKTGSNTTGDGTQAKPWATIQYGTDNVTEGGTVHVAAGTYVEPIYILQSMTLEGAGAHNTFIDGGSSNTVVGIGPAVGGSVTVSISGVTIQNGSQDNAGGIFIYSGNTLSLNDCTVRNNTATTGGGIVNLGTLIMNRCTISGNSAVNQGGGIYNSGTADLTNCTVSGNRMTQPDFNAGGGIYNNGTMSVLNCTIAYNSGNPYTSGGGFHDHSCTTMTFKNSIVAHNTADGISDNGYTACDGVTSLGHNLDSEDSCDFDQPTDKINTNPLLGTLRNNGGPTFTHALLEGSPAIDAGTNAGAPATDQRGVTRPQGASCDIGAYELIPIPITTQPEPPPPAEPRVSPATSRPLNPALMSLQYLSVNPQQTSANQPVTITINAVNTGDEAGNINIALKINGQLEQSRMVSVGPQGTQPVKFTVAKAKPGTYNVTILDKSGSFTILGASGTTRAPVNGGLIAILIIGVLVLATVMVFLLTRRPA